MKRISVREISEIMSKKEMMRLLGGDDTVTGCGCGCGCGCGTESYSTCTYTCNGVEEKISGYCKCEDIKLTTGEVCGVMCNAAPGDGGGSIRCGC